MRTATAILAVLAVVVTSRGLGADLADPRADPYFAVPPLRALLDWVTLRFTFDADQMLPDMAVGSSEVAVRGTPQFADGVSGRALVVGGESGAGTIARALNVPLESRGAVSLWLCPVAWTHTNGPNTEFVMTNNASVYVERQGPMHNEEGVVTRQESLLYLMLSPVTGNNCLAFGTEDWPLGQWRLLVANWSWPAMSFSLDGGEFQSVTVRESPSAEMFGDLVIGSSGGEKTLMDELTVYRRPLTREEARTLFETFRPQAAAP